MMEYGSDFQEVVRLQLMFRSLNRILKNQTHLYEPELSSQESTLHSLLSTSEPKTISEVAEMMGIEDTEAYYLLVSLQDKELVKVTPSKPIKFVAIKKDGLSELYHPYNKEQEA